MTHKQIFPESWNLNQILYGLLVAYVFLLPIHLNLAIGLFLVMVVLNFANILKTGQFWPKVTVPKKISRPLWALFLLSAVSVCWSQEPFLSAYNWIVVVGLKAGSFYLSCVTAVRAGGPCFLSRSLWSRPVWWRFTASISTFWCHCHPGCGMDRSRRVPAHDQTGCLNVGKPQYPRQFPCHDRGLQ